MKKYLLWSFERGSRAYDAICLVILAFIFLAPHSAFHDRRACLDDTPNESICQTTDAAGRPVWVVKVKTEQDAVALLRASGEVDEAVAISSPQPQYDAVGRVVAYSISIQR
jgi:hypothetical protein